MDANKDAKLAEMGYTIAPCCGLCTHASFPSDNWGTCKINQYQHQKHGDTRDVSISSMGVCSRFSPDHEKIADVAHFRHHLHPSLFMGRTQL